MAVDRGNGDGVPQPQVVELVKLRGGRANAVALVDAKHHRLAAFPQQGGHVVVVGGDPGGKVGDQDDDIGGLDGQLGLAAHFFQQHIVGLRLDAPGIHQAEALAQPLPLGVDAVPCDAGGVLHNGKTPADKLIKQGGFAHVGPPHHSDKRFCHLSFYLLSIIRGFNNNSTGPAGAVTSLKFLLPMH